jgi:manganese transport protein
VQPFLSKSAREKKQLPHGPAEFITAGSIQYQHIGIAIDFSGNDQRIIQNALMVGGREAKYTFIHIVESAAARYFGKNALDHETNLDKSNLAEYKQRLEELGYLSDARIGYGKPAVEIAKVVGKQNIDLLVMGAHGHKGFKDLMFGTTVDAVRHRISIPVLVIK